MLGLSLTASYALRILAYLARHPERWVRGADPIANATGVPRAYAVRVLHSLGRAGLVLTRVGRHGGYRLAGDPDETSALDVVTAVDGPGLFDRCLLGLGRCSSGKKCALHPRWSRERTRIERCLGELTLGVLASHASLSTGNRGESDET